MFVLTQVAPYRDGPAGVHGVLTQATTALGELASMADLEPVVVADVSEPSAERLARGGVLALFTIGETPFSSEQRAALDTAWRAGRLSVLGVHSATDACHGWADYGQILGARFDGHPWTQTFDIEVVDPEHPATAHLPRRWSWHDEIYLFAALRDDAHVLLSLGEGQVDMAAPGARVPDCGFPLAWTLEAGPARTFYSALGHFPGAWETPAYLRHLAGVSPGCAVPPDRHLGRALAPPPVMCDAGVREPRDRGGAVSEVPEVMAAAVYQEPGVVTVEERPVPSPGPGEVSIEVDHCGICGSDIHMLRDGWGNRPGLIAGHEYTGTIAALGEGVAGWSVGRPGGGGPSPKCGHCRRCLENKPSQCENREGSVTEGHDGAFAGYIVTRAVAMLALPPGCRPATPPWPNPWRWRSTASPVRTSLPGDTAMVIGVGPIGALTIAALKARGIGPITAVEPGEKRKQLARELGADTVFDPAELEIFALWDPERTHLTPSTWCSSVRVRVRPSRPALTNCAAAAPWPWSGPARTPSSTPTGSS